LIYIHIIIFSITCIPLEKLLASGTFTDLSIHIIPMKLLQRLVPFLALFFFLQFLLRGSLLVRATWDTEFTTYEIVQLFLRGLWMDSVTASFLVLPVALYHLALPARLHGTKFDRRCDGGMRLLFSFAMLFDAVSEYLFWSEFTTRFNFIAVDYLVYTQEVIGNIVESYPIVWIIGAIIAASGAMAAGSIKVRPLAVRPSPLRQRAMATLTAIAICIGLYSASNTSQTQFGDNAEAHELASNGVYNLFYAFWNNEINYERFYATHDTKTVERSAAALLDEEGNVRIDPHTRTRLIHAYTPEQRKNVVIVAMESMSAAYMQAFGNTQNLTPNLDRFAKEGLFFTNLYATGTRTVRGLEAITLSIPPTPGQSLIRRIGNDDLFSLGFIFKDRGYDTKFLYGGYGYFDNMNAFFAANGFDIVDRTNLKKNEITFANVWGVCDEDMFQRLIREADASYAAHKPFMHLLMTTSNHRPYTYPDGKIDIPSHSNRAGGVKYADYSVGKLIEWAKEKPWFNDTVFIFVADHTAGAGGKAELDPAKYHIPMIFYAPGFIKPQRYEKIASQIDLAPVLLGQLGFRYYSKFYGEDVLHDADEDPHAFISNYQKVALVRDGVLTVLSPKRGITQYSWPDASEKHAADAHLAEDAIAYYQSASWWRESYKRIPTVVR
jgi:phosphoglycerol transferase MdoB-like AlkP superfamily enzyme